MTRLAFGAFGANSIEADGFTATGAPSVVASPFTGGGPYALRCVATTIATYVLFAWSTVSARGYYLRARVRISGTPAADTLLMGLGQTVFSNAPSMGIGLANGSRDIRLVADGALQGAAGPTLAVDTDYLFEVFCMQNTSGSDTVTGQLDGVQFATATGAFSNVLPANFGFGLSANAGITAHYTDWAINDDQGADNNSWPGDARTALLFPVSDDTIKSNIGADAWRAGNTGTTNLFAAVDDVPPIGAASPGTTSSQVVCDTPSVGRNYVPVTETYNSKVGANDTINVVQAVIAEGESVSTGTKTGNVDLLDNPVNAGVANFTYGNDLGAVGTYPSNWQAARSVPTVAPTVIRTSGVSIRAQMFSSTRNADICFMGAYVDYTPAAAGKAPPPRPLAQRLPHVMR